MSSLSAPAILAFAICATVATTAGASLQPRATEVDASTEPATSVEEAMERWADRGGWLDLENPPGEPIPPNENAAVVYERALAALARCADDTDMLALGEFEAGDDPDAVRTIIANCSEVIELVVEAGAMEQCRWTQPKFPDGPFDPEAPQVRGNRDLFLLLRASFLLGRADGDVPQMMRSAIALVQLGGHMARDHALTGFLVAIAIEAGALHELAEMAKRDGIPKGMRGALRDELESRDWEQRFLDSLRVEGAEALEMIDMMAEDAADDEVGPGGEPIAETLDALRLASLNSMLELLDYYETPRAERPAKAPRPDGGEVEMLVGQHVETFERAYRAVLKQEARIAVALAALDVLEEFGGAESVYPRADRYTPARINPFTGAPVNYALAGDGFAVWIHDPDPDGHLFIWWTE